MRLVAIIVYMGWIYIYIEVHTVDIIVFFFSQDFPHEQNGSAYIYINKYKHDVLHPCCNPMMCYEHVVIVNPKSIDTCPRCWTNGLTFLKGCLAWLV